MAVVFEISSSLAMFRKPYTTTSSVSYPFPPPTAIAGTIGAILGYHNGSENDAASSDYWDKMKGTRIGVKLLGPVRWYTSTVNFWNIKNPQKSPHIQVKHQFVKEPKYRIFVSGGLEKELILQLEQGNFVFTPYLGTAYNLAEVRYAGCFKEEDANPVQDGIDTLIPISETTDIEVDILRTTRIFKERVPYMLDTSRQNKGTVVVLYTDGNDTKIFLKKGAGLNVTKCGNDNVAWFTAW